MKEISIFLVDDHTALREAVRVRLEAEEGLTVVGESGNGMDALVEIDRLRPDLAVVDLRMPEMPGLTLIPKVREASPKTAILVFTMHDSPAYVYEAMHLGANGYVLKTASMEELIRGIRAAASGADFLQAEVTRPLLRRVANDARLEGGASVLSLREIQVVELLSEGKANKEISTALSISEETVKSHLKRIYEKLGASDRAQAVAIALRQNLID